MRRMMPVTEPRLSQPTEDGKLRLSESLRWKDWREVRIAFFDLETTSLNVEPLSNFETLEDWFAAHQGHRIVEFGGQIRVGGEVVDSLYQFINPEIPIPEDASKVHGITDEMVKEMPTFKDSLEDISRFLSSADLICAYNGLGFDKGFLEFEASRVLNRAQTIDLPFIDPYILYVEINKKRFKNGKNNLKSAASHYGCGQSSSIAYGQDRAHRTEPDVNMCADLLYKMGVRDLPYSVDELLEVQAKWAARQSVYVERRNKKKAEARSRKKTSVLDDIKE